jgi:hypothetical protein
MDSRCRSSKLTPPAELSFRRLNPVRADFRQALENVQETAMIDPAEREDWIDAPHPSSHSNDPVDEIDEALDALADAIKRPESGEGRSIASGLPLNPAMLKIADVFASLPSSRLIALLERNSDGSSPSDVAAALPAVVASGAADRVGRALSFRRITMSSRINALKRACDSLARQRPEAHS